jgi:hypothetical protein
MALTRPTASGQLDILLPMIGKAGDVHPVIELGTALRNRGVRHFAHLLFSQTMPRCSAICVCRRALAIWRRRSMRAFRIW